MLIGRRYFQANSNPNRTSENKKRAKHVRAFDLGYNIK